MGAHHGSAAANGKITIRSLIKFQKACEQNEEAAREAVSSDRSLGRASDGDTRAHHVSNEELADDRDKHTESQNVGDDTVVVDPGSSESKNGDDNMAEGPPTCPECRKAFSSLKALYGHMRCHPLRSYRGARRPPKANKKLQTGAGSSSDRVPTAKRAEANAARILLLISRSNDLRPTPSPRLEGKGLQLMDASTDVEAPSSQSVFERRVEKKKNKKKMMKDLESVHECGPPTRGRYHCSSCSKSFSSHQALGGHIASHNKNKNHSEEVDETEDSNLAHAEERVDSNNLVPRAATAEHRCTLCPAAFLTGQALGGHKRKHWKAAAAAPSPPAPAPAPSSESVGKANNVVFDIDLNELPTLEAEEP